MMDIEAATLFIAIGLIIQMQPLFSLLNLEYLLQYHVNLPRMMHIQLVFHSYLLWCMLVRYPMRS